MKHLKPYIIFESIEDLPKGKNGKPIYPMEKIEDFIEKFTKYYQKSMVNQGWDFFICDYSSILNTWDVSECGDFVYRVEKSDFNDRKTDLENDEEAAVLAQKYGIVSDDNGVVYDFDNNVFQDHLLTGLELGLMESKKQRYNFKKIKELVVWFEQELGDWAEKQGWAVFLTDLPSCVDRWNTTDVYRIESVETEEPGDEIPYEEAEERAKQIGFVLDDMGVVYDFDKEKFNKNKHLISGVNLGLL